MPTYEYRCADCGEHLEVVQSFTDAALTECPACSGRLRKVFGNIGITFKGSGFYKTDSRAGAGRANGAKDTSKDGASGNGTSEPKPEGASKEASAPKEPAASKGDSAATSKGDSKPAIGAKSA